MCSNETENCNTLTIYTINSGFYFDQMEVDEMFFIQALSNRHPTSKSGM
ncbi:MAG: hypothetical protein Q8942_16110 [Bacillota bacterium]|nr:hypothetical protein [Bacillota bacterium]